ncbi:MAG TPA: DUF3341 domain-containing protein [Crenalkalicoccus sp.]|jgi:hypothetical protein|nr:DUF3341 domain-containing protein [Crenalkalicoccus sp.]
MTTPRRILLAEFADPDTLVEAARRARAAGLGPLDAHTPFAVHALNEALGLPRSRIRVVMFVAGALAAAFAFGMQWYSAVIAYPIDSGGRPLNSWPAFLVPSFEFTVLAAALAGVAAFLFGCRLPGPHHPVFAARGFDRASQDRFFLAVGDPEASETRLAALLDGLAPLSLQEVRSP